MKQIIVKNPNILPCIEHNNLTVLQGDLKTLSEEDMGKLCHSIQKHCIPPIALNLPLVAKKLIKVNRDQKHFENKK